MATKTPKPQKKRTVTATQPPGVRVRKPAPLPGLPPKLAVTAAPTTVQTSGPLPTRTATIPVAAQPPPPPSTPSSPTKRTPEQAKRKLELDNERLIALLRLENGRCCGILRRLVASTASGTDVSRDVLVAALREMEE